jgi:Tol biopolymer transport system component
MQMHRFLRVGFLGFLPLFCIFFTAGCQEYNPNRTTSEVASLSSVIQLTTGFDRAGEAYFSPDFRWIIFRAVARGQRNHELYLAKIIWNQNDIAGIEKPIRITPIDSRSEGGSFSADGLSLIFSSTAGSPSSGNERFPAGMHIFRVDGWEGAISMTDVATGTNLAQHAMLGDQTFNAEGSYSPNGQHIIFTSTRNGNPNLYVMHADGSNVIQLTNTAGYDGHASFSPDGKHLVYCSERDEDHLSEIFTADLSFDANGEITGLTNEHALTYDHNMNISPHWNPDGKHIIYSTSRHGRDNYELYLMDRTGRKKTRITWSPGADIFPVFSPDGRFVMWTSKRAKDGSIQVFLGQFQFPLGS